MQLKSRIKEKNDFLNKCSKIIKQLIEIIKERKFKYIAFFWFIISVQFVIGYNLQNKGYSINSFSGFLIDFIKIIVLSVVFIILHYFVIEVLRKIKEKGKTKSEEKVELKKYRWGIYFLIIIICWIPTLLAFYPAIISYDGGYQIRDYIYFGKLIHHPILTTILYSSFYMFGLIYLNSATIGMFLFSIFQMTFMALVFSYTVKFIEEETNKKWLRNITLIFYALFPYNQLFAIITTKDVIFSGLLIIFVINLYKMLKGRFKVCDYIFLIIISVLMLLSRNNVVHSLKVLIPLVIIVLIKDKRTLIKTVAMLFIIIQLYQTINNCMYKTINQTMNQTMNQTINQTINQTVNQTVKQTSNENPMRIFIFSQAIARIVKDKGDMLTEEEKEKISYYFKDYEKLAKVYAPNIADGTASMINNKNINIDKNKFFKFVLQLGMKYPITFLDSFLDNTRGFWYISDKSFNQVINDKYRYQAGALELYCMNIGKYEGAVIEDSKLPKLKAFYRWLFCENEYTNLPILYVVFQPGIYFYITLANLLYSIYKKDKANLVIGIFLFIYFASCFLAACAIIRYMYAIIVCVPIMGCLAIKTEKDREEKQ